MNLTPLIVKFSKPLSEALFNVRLVGVFEHKTDPFQLWGNPIRLGPTKVHVYGADRGTWTPVNIELTESGCVLMCPQAKSEKCAADIRSRFARNILKYIDPEATFRLGKEPFTVAGQTSPLLSNTTDAQSGEPSSSRSISEGDGCSSANS